MKVLGFDTETTGLPFHPDADLSLQPKVIEFGALMMDSETGEELETWSILINPREPLSAAIKKITGIEDADLKHAPYFADAWPEIQAAFLAADVVVAHNAPFDTSLINFELARMGIKDFKWPPVVCTVQENVEAWGRRVKLIELFEDLMEYPFDQKHRALDDVRHMMACVRKIKLFEAPI
jgi:DNA polymerase III alpha subunit (gram-positive type)